jgi:YD repeat-containing protein
MKIKNGTYKVVIENGNESWYDSNGNMVHSKDSDGYESWREYDSNGNMIHYKDSNGYECWFDSNGKEISKKEFDRIHGSCDGKVVTIEGKSYQLKEIKS